MLSQFSYLMPLDLNESSYIGLITIRNRDFKIQLNWDESKKQMTLSVDDELRYFFQKYQSTVEMKLKTFSKDSSNLQKHIFLREVQDIINKAIATNKDDSKWSELYPEKLVSSSFYNRITNELQQIGWNSIEQINEEFSKFSVTVQDVGKRSHAIDFELPPKYPYEKPRFMLDAPQKDETKPEPIIDWNPITSTISQIVESCKKYLNDLNDFWIQMEDLDKNCLIIESELILRRHYTRRIGIGSHSSLQIEVDPWNPRSIPLCRFFGAESIVSPLREKLVKNTTKWNFQDVNLRINLQNLLDIEFPKPVEEGSNPEQMEDAQVYCGICYGYKIFDEAVDKVCDNPKCAANFHSYCLVAWFKSNNAKQSFDTLFGNCPYCQHSLQVVVRKT